MLRMYVNVRSGDLMILRAHNFLLHTVLPPMHLDHLLDGVNMDKQHCENRLYDTLDPVIIARKGAVHPYCPVG